MEQLDQGILQGVADLNPAYSIVSKLMQMFQGMQPAGRPAPMGNPNVYTPLPTATGQFDPVTGEQKILSPAESVKSRSLRKQMAR